MVANVRHEQILALVERQGFAAVKELSALLGVSAVTIRRDLEHLEHAGRLGRTHGGALPLQPPTGQPAAANTAPAPPLPSSLADRVDVLITAPVDPSLDRTLLERANRRGISVIAESVGMLGTRTLVALDNYAAGAALGRWAGAFALEHFEGRANILDLTYPLPNTQARSQGFIAGVRERIADARLVLSLNCSSARQPAYQLAQAALDVYPEINIIFGINDITALGAIDACAYRGIPADAVVVLSFGLEGDTLRNSLLTCAYCQAGLAMFPEIVGPVCVEAAILAHNDRPLPAHLLTPHAVLTPKNLAEYYSQTDRGWKLNWEQVAQLLTIPLSINGDPAPPEVKLPQRIGFMVPFSEHEWYQTLADCMYSYCSRLGIELEVVDTEQHRRDNLALHEREIATVAAAQVAPGDVILIDAGQITTYLAEALAERKQITVITNAMAVFECLRGSPGITLILTGGVFRRDSNAVSGPTAQLSLRELRADKLFLTVSGITAEFGLSHTDLAEVAMKQAMIRAAREVIVLADHSKFGQESISQVAPLSAVHRLITDNALPAGTRLELSKRGIEVIIAPVG